MFSTVVFARLSTGGTLTRYSALELGPHKNTPAVNENDAHDFRSHALN